jgi:hypothetical protein
VTVLGRNSRYDCIQLACNGGLHEIKWGFSCDQGARPTGVYTAQDEGILAVAFRAQRAFATGSDFAGFIEPCTSWFQ